MTEPEGTVLPEAASDPNGVRRLQSALRAVLPGSLSAHLGRGQGGDARLPPRVERLVQLEEERSERLIGWVQLVIISTFGLLYLLSPRPTDAAAGIIEPVPLAIGGYMAFTLARIAAAHARFLPGWLLVLSMIVDVAMLYVLIWTFHIAYDQPPAFYLKVPTFAYIFVFIAVRALRFDPRFVLSQGLFAAAGWLAMVAWAVAASEPGAVTRSFSAYLTDNLILLGAEFDKIFTILVVTAVLSLALYRARRTLITAVRESAATRDMRRFLSEGVADVITSAEEELTAGTAADRHAAVLMLDIRSFTRFAETADPRDVVAVLTCYHDLVVPIVNRHGGVIDKFLGDGVMATFGAVAPSATAAADAVAALEAILEARQAWAARLEALGAPPLAVNGAVASGRIVFAVLGNAERLEYTVIGTTANLAAKLEKHNKAEGSLALVPAQTMAEAGAQGFAPRLAPVMRKDCRVDGVEEPMDLFAYG